MLAIIWLHVRWCVRDIKAYRIGHLTISSRTTPPGQVVVGNKRHEWRLR